MDVLGEQAPLYEIKAGLFKGLAHPLRIRVLEVLSSRPQDWHRVSDLLEVVDIEASHLSQHLAVLRRHGVVVARREGNAVSYRLTNRSVADLLAVARRFLVETLDASTARRAAADDLPAL